MKKPHALIVDDDPEFRASLADLVAAAGFLTEEAGTVAEARSAIKVRPPEVVFLDLDLPDGDGRELRFEDELPADTPFVVVTGHASVASAVEALREGASDYLTKPVDPTQLEAVLHALKQSAGLRREVADLREALRESGRFGDLVGRAPCMQKVYDLIGRVAPTTAPVLVTGESGTGKELVAGTLHALSPRRDEPLVTVNCGAIPETLVESELFGHEKGSFTGADATREGVFERADGGTLFLDEIGEMAVDLQVRLLRVLESGEIVRVGGKKPIAVDVRIVAATNRDPAASVAEGQLRKDLLYRLNVFPIHLPPLRDRGEDVVLLAEHFLDEQNRREGTSKRWTPEALAALQRRHWEGNVRELRNVVERAWILADDVVGADLLPAEDAPTATGGAAVGDGTQSLRIPVGLSLAEVERRVILATLEACEGNKRKTARTLGVSAKTLYNRLRDYDEAAGAEDATGDGAD